jgi:carboxyl-terminal processing protease
MKTKASIVAWMLGVAMALGSGHIVGVGMELSKGSENEPAKIKRVVPAAPATKAGIQAGWILLSINGTNTAGRSLSECVSLVRGEEGTRVRLSWLIPLADEPMKSH